MGEGEIVEAGIAPEVQRGTTIESEVGTGGDLATLADAVGQGGVVEGDATCGGKNDLGVGSREGSGAGIDHSASRVGVWSCQDEGASVDSRSQDEASAATAGVVNNSGVHGQDVLIIGNEQLFRTGGESTGADASAV